MAMSDEHKAALAQGRRQAAAIKRYLEALQARRPGRPVTRESLEERLRAVEKRIAAEEDALKAVELVQQRMDLEDRIASFEEVDISELEAGFVEHARGYSERKQITYGAWRERGVPAEVLRRAGVPRTRRVR
jgi:predicted  nucleic acid-binding Zn-ribbon protein